MIRPGGFRGAAFGTATEGDLRVDAPRRHAVAKALGIAPEWASVTQVHGDGVVEASAPGLLGEADAIVTHIPGLPAAVGTADCVPVILEGDEVAAVIHVGWRGAAAGVVERTLAALDAAGTPARRGAIGPSIGPCCYEVGEDVAARFPDNISRTRWGTTSVDLPGFVADRLSGLTLWRSELCTFTDDRLFSHRRDHTRRRQVAVTWLPSD